MKKKDIEFKKQLKLNEEINGLGYNIVTCGNCGAVILVKKEVFAVKIICYDCSCVSEDGSDFPDLFY